MNKNILHYEQDPLIHDLAKYFFKENLTESEQHTIEQQLNTIDELKAIYQSVINGIAFFKLENYQQFIGMDKTIHIQEMRKEIEELSHPILMTKAIIKMINPNSLSSEI